MHTLKKNFLIVLLVSLVFWPAAHPLVEKLFYTTVKITNPLIVQLVQSQAFQRLKEVRQYGIAPLILKKQAHTKDYNRYNHSLGVYWLTERYGAPLTEQAAALLHDASHTAFSHVGDTIFRHKDGKSSYQDDHHLEFLSETDIPSVLKNFGLTLEDINHKNPLFTCLEQDLPDICADRLEYNLAGGVLEKLISPQNALDILEHLKFENNRWYFTDAAHAAQFARISLWHTEHVWGTQLENSVSEEFAEAVRAALSLNIISLPDIKHGTDDAIWRKLLSCNSAEVNNHILKMVHTETLADTFSQQPRNNKFRGINPWVQVGDTFKRLTELDADFKAEYERVKAGSY